MKALENSEKYRDEIVQAVLNLNSINDDGNLAFQFSDWSEILRYQNLLTYILLKDENFEQRFDDARYWFLFPKNPMTDEIIGPIIHQLKIENEGSFEKCKFLLEKRLQEAQKEPLQDFDLFFFLDIEPGKNFSPFSVSLSGISVDFYTTDPLNAPLSSPNFKGKLRFINDRMENKYPDNNSVGLHLRISARNPFYAMKEGIQLAEFILSWIGLINNFNSGPTYMFSFTHSYEKCPSLALLLVGNQEKECVGEIIWKFKGLQKDCLIPTKDLKKFLSLYSGGSTESQEILRSAMNAYSTGLHEDNMGSALLAFWATIERLCLQDNKLSHSKMLNRLYFLIPPISKIELNMLLELRNKAIHQWDYDMIREHERHLVKGYADLLINFFIKHFMSFTQDEIRCFYTYINCNSKQLEELKITNYNVFNLIKKMRNI
jgi:hypothetical protein